MMEEFWQDPLKNEYIPPEVQRQLLKTELHTAQQSEFNDLNESVDKYDVE
jgi:hypothetical protein